MKRYILIVFAICLANQSTVEAQRGGILRDAVREFGGQLIEQQLRGLQQDRRQLQPPQQEVQGYGGMKLPSEGGNNSGGDRREFQPDYGFILPGNGPGNVRPQPVVETRPRYVQPQPSQTIYTDGFNRPYVDPGFTLQPGTSVQPYSTSQPVVTRSVATTGDMPSSPVMTNQYVVIRCPAEILGSIQYTLKSAQGSYRFTMSGGQEQRFKVNNPWSISYNDGTSQRRYVLRGGVTYTMKRRPDNGWQLYSTKAAGS